MPLDPRPPYIIAKRGQKIVSGKKDQITIIGCANAIGPAIPPMVIFEGKLKSPVDQWRRAGYVLWHEWKGVDRPGTV